MAVLVTIQLPGMTAAAYDEVSALVRDKLAGATGFVVHAARLSRGGITVTEVWESSETRRRWLQEHFRLPEGTTPPGEAEEVELYNLEVGQHRTTA